MIHDPLVSDVRARYLAGDLVIFAGAGVSQAAGLPSWSGLINRVLDGAEAHDRAGELRDAIARARRRLAERDLIGALTTAERHIPAPLFVRLVKAALDDSGREVPEVARVIAGLGDQLRAVLTTNLDRFFERAFGGRWRDSTAPTLDLGQERRYILKLHGTLHDSDSWVLTRDRYESLIHARPGLQAFLRALYLTRSFLFVGYGLRDPDFDLLLGWMRTFAGNQPPRHFALMPEGSVDPDESRDLARAGIDVIVYPNHDGSHAEVVTILSALGGGPAAAPTRPVVDAPASPPAPPPAHADPTRPPRTRLVLLLELTFNVRELRRLLAEVEPRLETHLREDGPLAELAFDAVTLLERRGLVGRAIDLAASARPQYANDFSSLRPFFR